MRRTVCYIDGFNLYHSIADLGLPHLKWLDLRALASTLLRNHQRLIKTHYFSAYATWLPGAYSRHRKYTAALKACGVAVTIAHFKDKTDRCRRCGARWTRHEEKETDVHIALWLLADAEDDLYDDAILVTADSDLLPPVRMIRARHPNKRIIIAAPPGRWGHGRAFQQEADSYFEITKGRLKRSSLQREIFDENGILVVTRPTEYDPPV